MKRGRRGKVHEEEESSASSAPNDDVLYEIFLRLPASSVWRFRKVCRFWNSLATDPSFVRLHTRRHCNDAAGPKSMLIHCNPYTESTKMTLCIGDAEVNNNQIYHRNVRIPVKPEYATSGLSLQLSCDGLLCFMSSLPRLYHICNPVTKTWTTIAAAASPYTYLRGFYFHPSTGEYRLLQYFYESSSFGAGYEVATVNGGGNNTSWRRVYQLCRHPVGGAGNLDQLLAISFSQKAPIIVGGNLHWLPEYDPNDVGVIVFDTSSEKFRSIPIPYYIEQDTLRPVLLEIGGNLCIGCPIRSPRDMEIRVLKDHKNQQWVPTHTIISDQGISTTPSEDANDEVAGSLLRRWNYNGSQFSLYDLKHKTCRHIHIRELSYFWHCVNYTESLVTV